VVSIVFLGSLTNV